MVQPHGTPILGRKMKVEARKDWSSFGLGFVYVKGIQDDGLPLLLQESYVVVYLGWFEVVVVWLTQ